jgi:two-component system sensor histidine kinase UhpB
MALLMELDVRTLISLPLYDCQELIGYLVLASPGKIQAPTPETLEFLKVLVQNIELAISNARLLKQLSDSQNRLRALSNHLVEVQESERRELRRELTDEIGQMLSLLNLNLEQVKRMVAGRLGAESEAIAPLDAGRQQVEGLLHRIRDLSLDLHPGGLDELGLRAALLDYFERFTRFSGMKVNFKQSGLEWRFSREIETGVFRIIQEALSNSARHSGASEVEVLIWTTTGHLGVKIHDAGVGFDVHEVKQSSADNGLSGMSERAAACGGRLEIESAPGQGVTLMLEVPIQPPDTGAGEQP